MHERIHHPQVIKRLKRAHGHLKSVISMLEDERPCLDIVQQLEAVESAISNAKRTLVHEHINHCLEHAVEDGKYSEEAVEQFKKITKYL